MEKLIQIMTECGAGTAAAIKYDDCDIINQRLADKIPFAAKSVFIGTIPYYTHFCDESKTVSSYALAYDYHTYIKNLGESIIKEAKQYYPNANFMCFGDHSPINEKIAAAKAGLGIIGEHSLLITPNYSSFVFLFEIITDIECDAIAQEVKYCEKCGKCQAACPSDISDKKICLSALTQKKGVLTNDEVFLIKKSSCAWGCDICQEVCPHTISAKKRGTIYTNNSWFNSNVLNRPSEETVAHISDFNSRAYSWRGSTTILRNLNIINSDENGESK